MSGGTSPAEARPASRKLAAAVAARIVGDISDAGWPEGEVFGSEPELLERYGVSRAVFREAVRLLEHQEVARMRRGPGGGLVVTLPSVESVIQAVMVYLLYVQASFDEVFEARQALEQEAAILAAERLGEDHLARLRELVEQEASGEVGHHHVLHVLVAAASGNPALEFFVDLLHRVTLLYAPESGALTRQVFAASVEAHSRIVDSIIGGDASRAARRMRSHLDAEATFIRGRMPSRLRADAVFAQSADGGRRKMAETMARQVFAEVVDAGWPVGELLGSEAELMQRFDVSRAVLREAVRVLEHHQVARMRRGPGGGLQVAAPGIDATTVAMALHLDRLGVQSDHLYEVRGIVEMAVLERVIADVSDSTIEALDEVLAHPPETVDITELGRDLHTVLATLSGNRVLELLTDVLVRLSRGLALRASVAGPAPALDELHGAHCDIVAAIVDRDAALARYRMRRHLETLPRWIA